MRIRNSLFSAALLAVSYFVVLIWLDSRNQLFQELTKIQAIVPALLCLSLLSYFLRFLRWHWLLGRQGEKIHFGFGFLAYLTGFVFTATPGKVGELVRIRYLSQYGVAPWKVLAAFIYERGFDLIAVLLLAALAIKTPAMFALAFGFVFLLIAVLVLLVLKPDWLLRLAFQLRVYKFRKTAQLIRTLKKGLAGCRHWVSPLDIGLSLIVGVLAWGITSISFVVLIEQLGVSLSLSTALAIYPLAILVGAASMLPGGAASTEIAITSLLSFYGIALFTATIAAVSIRFTTMWFSVLCGLAAVGILEISPMRAGCRDR